MYAWHLKQVNTQRRAVTPEHTLTHTHSHIHTHTARTQLGGIISRSGKTAPLAAVLVLYGALALLVQFQFQAVSSQIERLRTAGDAKSEQVETKKDV